MATDKLHILEGPQGMDRVEFRRIGRGHQFWVIIWQREVHNWHMHSKKRKSNETANKLYLDLKKAGWKLVEWEKT